jgi:hypothetical protein
VAFLSLFRLGSILRDELESGARFEQLRAPYSALKDIHFIQFSKDLPDHGRTYGLATHRSFKMAQIIAYFEYLDRKAYLDRRRDILLSSTNGVAAHAFRLLATNAAKDELFERDAFLVHWHTQQPFAREEIPLEFKSLQAELGANNLTLEVGRSTLGLKSTFVCLLKDETMGGFVTGSSIRPVKKDALFKAIIEAVISYSFGSYGKTIGRLRAEFRQNGFTNLESHRTYWLYERPMPPWLRTSDDPKHLQIRHLRPKFKIQLLTKDPFPVVSADSSDLLSLGLGPPSDDDFALLTTRLKDQYVLPPGEPHPLF